jgi:AMMECR1 domain-containing protein
MLKSRPALFLLLLAALVALPALLPACGGDEPAPPPAADRSTRTPRADDGAEMPSEPIPFAVAPLQGDSNLDLGADVKNDANKTVKLKTLVRERTLVVYMSADTKDRQNRAATRLLKPVVQAGRHAGFRIVVVFTQGTKASDVDTWFRKRKIPRNIVWAVDFRGEFAADNSWSPRTAALIDDKGLVGELFEPTDGWDSRLGFSPALSSDLLAAAWAMPDQGPAIDEASMQSAVELVRGVITEQAGGAAAEPGKTAFLKKKIDQPVFVSLFRPGQTKRLRGQANSGSYLEALADATRAALTAADDRDAWLAAAGEIRIQIDLMGEPGPIVTTGRKALWYLVEPGVHGVIVRKDDKEGILLPAEPVSQGLLSPRVRKKEEKHKKMFRTACKRGGLGSDDWRKDGVELLRFRSTSFGAVVGGGPAVPMFRGNVLWQGDPSEDDILESIKVGGLWLVNTVKEDGKFDYEYYPNQDKGSRGYNIVRHAGSVYGLLEMWELAGVEPALAEDRDIYLDASARAMGYVYDAMKTPDGGPEDRICLLDDRGRCDSGSAALTLLTMLVRPPKDQVPTALHAKLYRDDDEALMEGLGLVLTDMIDPKGKVFRRYSEARTKEFVSKEPLYYPGESMLALVRFYETTGDERWLEGARKIAERQMSWYERDRFINPDHWVMQGLYRLWRIDKEDRYADNAYAMGRHYASEQYGTAEPDQYGPLWNPWPDYLGSYRRTNDTPRTTRAGSRSEALRAVTNLAWERGDDATIFEDALLGAARHLMEQQYTERNGYWLPDMERAHGAYPMGVVDNHIRIDNNQHALVGVVGALHVERRRNGKPLVPGGAH